MKTRKFGKLSWPVSEIGFGAWAIGGSWGPQADDASKAALRRALDLGCTFVDTAAGYGNGHSERLIGEVLAERGLKGGGNGKVVVATKIPPKSPGHWPPIADDRCEDRYPEAYLRDQLEERLRNLKADTVDVLQLHTWNRAWNRNPTALEVLRKFRKEGTLRAIGISTPEHDQNALLDLAREGWLDSIQVIYNIFEQDAADELLPACRDHGVGVIVRVVFDEGVLTGKYTKDSTFPEGDFRRQYFGYNRLARAVDRVEKIRAAVAKASNGAEASLPAVAVRFALRHPAVSTVITGIRSVSQAEQNLAFSGLPPLADPVYAELKQHFWRRAFWHGG